MSNDTAKTSTINIVPVQGIFTETAELVTLIGPAGTPFYADIDPNQTGLHITNSTIDSSTIGATTPSTGVFTDIQTTTGSIATAPSADTDIVNKAYVDAVAQGLDIKASCLTASTANITTLSGLLTIDGILLTSGARVLVKNQSTQANNGIYIASAGAWSRSADMNTWAEVPSAFTFIQSGSTQANTGWVCTSQAGGTLGSTAITFVQFSSAGTYSAGTGLTLTGSQFSITNTGVTAATKGSASKTVTGVVNAQGQLTSFTDQDIAIAGTQITSGTIDTARLSGSYTGITGVGTLTDLTVTNTISGSITGNAATATTAGSATTATTATTATNLAGGLIGNVPYQTSAGATTFLATGSNTQVLTLAGGVPTWATPTTGTVTSVSGTGTVNGLTLTGTVTSTGSLTLGGTLDLSAPPAIGGTTAAAITGTTITANTKFLSTYFDANTSAGGSLRNLSGTACFQWGAGGGTNCTVDGSINMNAANAHIDMSPTGTGHVTINPTALGDMNNMAIGASTASTAKFTTLDISSTLALAGSTGTSGQTLVSQGASAPIWATPTAYASVTDDTTTNATRYPLFASVTTGNLTTEYVSSTKYNFNPSTGTLSATVFSGSGASLTSIPNSALTNSSVTIGSTAVALGATVTTFAGLTSVTSTTFVGALTGNASTATSATTATNATNTAITDDTTNASAVYPTWVTTTTGNLPQKTSSTKLSFIPNTGILTATGFAGDLTGNATNVTGTVALANGGTGKTTAPAAMANLIGFTTTVTSATPVVLTNTSSYYQVFTGSTAQTITLPVVSTLALGWSFHICNNSSAILTVNSSGSNLVLAVPVGITVMYTCILITGTTAASWEAGLTDFSTATGTGSVVLATSPTLTTPTIGVATATSINKMAITAPATSSTLAVADGKTFTASKTLTLTGTDSTTMTFPTTSATIARTDAAQTFTGTQTFSSDASIHGLAVGNGASSGTGNVVIGPSAGSGLSTGSNNVIIGGYTGAAAPISASGSGQIILSNGAGSVFGSSSSGGQWEFGQNGGVLTGLTAVGVEVYASSAGWTGLTAINQDATAPTQYTWNKTTTGNALFNYFLTEATVGTATTRGSISYNRAGGLTVYATTSDYRAKTVNGVIENALARTMQLKPCTGRMNDATENIDFFVAHELQAIIPSAVTGTKDAVKEDGTPDYQMVDKSAIIPLLVAAIQELKAEIDLLKGSTK